MCRSKIVSLAPDLRAFENRCADKLSARESLEEKRREGVNICYACRTKNPISSKRRGTYSRARRQFHLGSSTQRTRKGREQERDMNRETGKGEGSLKESSPAFSRRHRIDDDDDAGRRVASRKRANPSWIYANFHPPKLPSFQCTHQESCARFRCRRK